MVIRGRDRLENFKRYTNVVGGVCDGFGTTGLPHYPDE